MWIGVSRCPPCHGADPPHPRHPALQSEHKRLCLVEGWHDLLHEEGAPALLEESVAWLDATLAAVDGG